MPRSIGPFCKRIYGIFRCHLVYLISKLINSVNSAVVFVNIFLLIFKQTLHNVHQSTVVCLAGILLCPYKSKNYFFKTAAFVYFHMLVNICFCFCCHFIHFFIRYSWHFWCVSHRVQSGAKKHQVIAAPRTNLSAYEMRSSRAGI